MTAPRRLALTLDLKDDPALQAAYRRHHDDIPPEIEASLREAGIRDLWIYVLGTRLVMVMDVDDDFTFERKARLDAGNPAVQEWEQLMWRFQAPVAGAEPGQKWIMMDEIYHLGRPRRPSGQGRTSN